MGTFLNAPNTSTQATLISYCWWFRNPKQTPGWCKKPSRWWDFNYQPQHVIAGFQRSTVEFQDWRSIITEWCPKVQQKQPIWPGFCWGLTGTILGEQIFQTIGHFRFLNALNKCISMGCFNPLEGNIWCIYIYIYIPRIWAVYAVNWAIICYLPPFTRTWVFSVEYIFTGEVRKTEEAIREEYHRIIEESKKAAEVDLNKIGNFPLRIFQFPKNPRKSASCGRKLAMKNPRHRGEDLLKFGTFLDPEKTCHPNTEAKEVFVWMFIGYVHRFGKWSNLA